MSRICGSHREVQESWASCRGARAQGMRGGQAMAPGRKCVELCALRSIRGHGPRWSHRGVKAQPSPCLPPPAPGAPCQLTPEETGSVWEGLEAE